MDDIQSVDVSGNRGVDDFQLLGQPRSQLGLAGGGALVPPHPTPPRSTHIVKHLNYNITQLPYTHTRVSLCAFDHV